MSDHEEEVDYSKVDWTEIEEELEALEVIFPYELNIKQKHPYKLEIMINSSSEEEENYLKMIFQLEIPHDYPNNIPFMMLKNMSPDYLNNQNLDKFETEIRALARENLGTQMIFLIADYLREQIADINDTVLGKYKAIIKAKEDREREEEAPKISNMDHLNYTPVNAQTFGKWCKEFLAHLKEQEDKNRTEADLR